MHDFVLVKLLATPERTEGGIIVTDKSPVPFFTVQVEAVGPGRRSLNGDLMPLHVKKGDKLMIAAGSGLPMDRRKELWMIKEGDIYAKVTE